LLIYSFLRSKKEFAMAGTVTMGLLFLFLVSGCALRNQEEVKAPTAPEPSTVSISSTSAEPANGQAMTPANTTPSKEEIRRLQEGLKAAGFHPGPFDGIVGPKTRSALFRLQAACQNLKDLLETPNREIFQLTAGAQIARLDSVVNTNLKSAEIRLIQVRLKDTGFDPGPIDGVLGIKTRAALFRFQAGCTMLKNFPPTLDEDIQAAKRQTSPVPSRIESQSLVLESAAPAKSVRIESSKFKAIANQSLINEKVRQDQVHLRGAGFDPGPIDGILGPRTKAAMQRYQNVLRLKNSSQPSKIGPMFGY
jgi:peptidoglycan hydrolase-like protein with peptidoglycan-binding domain